MARAVDLRAAAGVLPAPADSPGPARRRRAGRRGRRLARRGRRRLERNPAGTPRAACGPEVYGRWEPAQLTAALSGYGITTGQIGRRIDGKTVNRRGPARADILTAITERNQNRGGG